MTVNPAGCPGAPKSSARSEAAPQTVRPSAKKSFRRVASALRELEALASAGLAGLLALLLSGIALDMARLFQGRPQFPIHFLQGPGDAVRHCAGLPGHSAAGDVDFDVDLVPQLHREEGGVGLLGKI